MDTRVDPYKHKERYLAWKESVKNGINGITPLNSEIILRYLNDMEKGVNISSVSVKGARSYVRLNSLREKLVSFSKRFEELYNIKKITDISEEKLITFFADMKNGTIRRRDGRQFKTIDTPARDFKAFWHWYQKISKKQGIEILDITTDLDTRSEKPEWVYLTDKQVKKLCDNAKPEYRALMMFLFDTGIRSPTELVNVKVSDLFNNFKELNIRKETSKTFGRRIKLMLCSEIIKEHVQNKDLKNDDYLFPIEPFNTNKYIKRLSERVFGDGKSPAGAKYSNLTMYDFRHCSCCYWLPRYDNETQLKYRFGWKKSDKIFYYSELLGMKDTITEGDLLMDDTKTELQNKVIKLEQQNKIMGEKIKGFEKYIRIIDKISKDIESKTNMTISIN